MAAKERGPVSTGPEWEAEQALLGSLLINGAALTDVAAEIRVEDFSYPAHGGIYAAMLRLHERGTALDTVTLANELGPAIEQLGGVVYMAELGSKPTTSLHVRDYALTVKRNSLQRGLYRVGEMLAGGGGEMGDKVARAQSYLQRAQVRLEPSNGHGPAKPDIIALADLMSMDLPAARWAIQGILPEGAHLLVGKSKQGKSWMGLGLILAVGYGGRALGQVPVEAGDALYLALEDNERRLQDRCRQILAQQEPPNNVDLALEWPRLDEGGLEKLEAWLTGHPNARLVVIDTLKKIRPAAQADAKSVYDRDYESLDGLHHLAAVHHVAILVIHHMRKGVAEDPLDTINGSGGLAAGVDGIWIFQRQRGANEATLYVTHREGEDQELAVTWDPVLRSWALAGDAGEYRLSKERREIIDFMLGHGESMSHREIADALDRNPFTTKRLVFSMLADGLLDRVGSKHYRVAADHEEKNGKMRGPRGPFGDLPHEDANVADHANVVARGPSVVRYVTKDHADHAADHDTSVARGPQIPHADGENGKTDHADHDSVCGENTKPRSIVPGWLDEDEEPPF